MPEKEDRKEPIKITDRRAFTLDGERRIPDEQVSPSESATPSAPEPTVKGEGFQLGHGAGQQPDRSIPPVEFSSFILSLASTAFIQLGELEDPVTRRMEINLEGAHQMIEILDMLRAKTKGNLDAQEEEFLTGVLYELKLKFAQKASKP